MNDKKVSKFLSLVLRHQPELANLTLDEAGWTDVSAVLAACRERRLLSTLDELRGVVERSDKQRYSLSADETRIRANQGHSVPVYLGLAHAEPPAELFHGTVERFVSSILEEGLRPGSRHAVHLSADVDTATKVGARRGKPVLLRVDSAAMHREGHLFQVSDNHVWLAAHVPPKFLTRYDPAHESRDE